MTAPASSNRRLNDPTKFSAALGHEELLVELDAEHSRLVIELANAPRFVVHKRVIERQDEIREITGNF